MNAAWGGVLIAGIGLLVGLIAGIWRGGRWVERVSTSIELLTKIADDHENRIRNGEQARARQAAARRSSRA